jgi:predicted regulator of Ras-like GTPase activity (Roadblock/LC7/MglB family)
MSKDAYTTALKTTLKEIQNICPDIKSSFIFTKDGTIVAGDSEASDTTIKKALHSFQSVRDKADAIGGLHELSVNGAEGRIQISRVSDIYLAITTSKNADIKYLQSITQVIVPTVLKLLKNIIQAPTPLKAAPPQQLTVEKITGFFVGDSAHVDQKLLKEWTKSLKGKTITTIEIQALNGRTTRCKVKAIDDEKMMGKGLIRIPDKVFKTLNVEEGALVRVKPTRS